MNNDYFLMLNKKLQNRIDALRIPDKETFYITLQLFLNFLKNDSMFSGILDELTLRYNYLVGEAKSIVNERKRNISPKNDEENTAIAYFVIKESVIKASSNLRRFANETVLVVAKAFMPAPERSLLSTEMLEAQELYYIHFINPLYLYLIESLESQRVVINFLQKYKQKCELFQREKLLNKLSIAKDVSEETILQREKKLQPHLYEYLHDQGWDLIIEPTSSSGEIDLIANQKHDSNALYIETKVYHDKTSKIYIANGLNQIYQYLRNYNETIGYLVIYNTTNKAISFDIPNLDPNNLRLTLSNKTIFIVTINIPENRVTASESGKHKPVVFTYDDLVQTVKEESGI